MSPETLSNFKLKQSEIVSNYQSNKELAMELDSYIGYFCDILLGDKIESYIYSASLIDNNLKDWNEGYIHDESSLFQPTFELLKTVLDGLENYSKKLDEPKYQKYINEVERNKKKSEKGKETKEIEAFKKGKNKNYIDARQAIFKKLIRLHREENNPLVIIKTAQNAYNYIAYNGYKSSDSLHILSVNYGGSLVGYYAKHIFQKLQGNGRVLINIGNIVYSIYDLKNANDFLGIIDYPFYEYINDFQSDEMKKFFQQRNHLLIFDDNTSSGRTLNDLSQLAKKTDVYGKIDVFACRANSRFDLYDNSVSEDVILKLISQSALETRKTKIGTIKRGYKELVGTYIGNNLYKSGYHGNK